MKPIALVVIALLIVVALTSSHSVQSVAAQSGGGYDLTWSTIDGGGGMNSTGGTYSLSGTIGQPDAGLVMGGSYSLTGGFWGGGNVFAQLFLPLILR